MKLIKTINPLITFMYFVTIITFLALQLNPIITTTFFITGLVFFLSLNENVKAKMNYILLYFIIILIFTITNPLFSHRGTIILLYLNDNPITLEAILYGVFSGLMVVDMIIWLKICFIIVDTDNLLYIISLALPKTALVISVILKMLPLFKKKSKEIYNNRLVSGFCNSKFNTLKEKINVFGRVITNLPEYIMELSLNMSARGFSSKKRSNYKLNKFTTRDSLFLLILITIILILTYFTSIQPDFKFYPELNYTIDYNYIFYMILFSIIPSFLLWSDNIKWKYLKSKI